MLTFYRTYRIELLSLTLAVLFLYMFGLNGPLFWDDIDWVVNNPLVHTFSWENVRTLFTTNILEGVHGTSNYYRPLMMFTMLFNYMIAGTHPPLYHIINNLLHLGNGVLMFYLLIRWLKNRYTAFIASLLYVIHPVHPEAVSYIVGRADPMSVFFILLGLVFYVHKKPWLAGGAAVCAIFTRETGILFPAYLAVALIAFELTGTFWSRLVSAVWRTLPYLALSGAYIALRLTVFNFQNSLNFYTTENIYTENILYRVYTFLDALTVYVRVMVWPTDLHFQRFLPVSTSLFSGAGWLGLLLVLVSIMWLFWLFWRNQENEFRVWFFGLGIFFSGLSLSSGIFVPVNSTILEHWLYFPLFGYVTIVAFYAVRFFTYLKKRWDAWAQAFILAIGVYMCFLGILTIDRNITWAHPQKLYQDIISHEPKEYRAINNLGSWYYNQRELETANELWARSIEYNPGNEVAFANLGNLYVDKGYIPEGEELLLRALDLQPDYLNVYRSLFVIYIREHRLEEASAALRTIEERFPKFNAREHRITLEKALQGVSDPFDLRAPGN